MILSLEGNYQEEHLFALKQALACWEFYQTQIIECDKAIEQLLQQMTADLNKPVEISKPKAIRHHKPKINNLHEKLLTLTCSSQNLIGQKREI